MNVKKVGYGSGKKDTGKFNALRITLGEISDNSDYEDEVLVIETNIDDSTPEILSYTMERLMEAGARDVFFTSVYMKKNRPATLLTCICEEEKESELIKIIFEQTSTIGIRKHFAKRCIAKRNQKVVSTRFGDVRVKEAEMMGITKIFPEYEDCRKIAVESGTPLMTIYNDAKKGERLDV